MKYINRFLSVLIFTTTLFSSCGKNNAPLIDFDYGCDGLIQSFEEHQAFVLTATDNYAGNPTRENCLNLKEALESYSLAIAALTAVEYCMEVEGEEFAGFVLSELLGTQEVLDQLGDCE